jgi:hypothetical protein
MKSNWCSLGRCQLKMLDPAILLADDYVLAGNSLMGQVACRVERPGWRRKNEVGEATLTDGWKRASPAIPPSVGRRHSQVLGAIRGPS